MNLNSVNFSVGSKLKFIVISSSIQSKSAGSMVLYRLPEDIRSLGYQANRILLRQIHKEEFLISVDEKNFIPFQTKTLEQYFDPEDVILIHGENLHHKYFDNFNVARFYLNKIGALKNIGVPRQGEYKIAWNSGFVENSDFILRRPLVKQPKNEVLRLDQPRLIDLTYVGKGAIYDSRFSRLPGTIELTRTWPVDDDEYLLLLSKTRFLFTFDVQSAVVEEAIVYGVIPVLMTFQPMSSIDELFKIYNEELAKCCLTFEEYGQITDSNFEVFLNNFSRNRQKFISYLDLQRADYPNKLLHLLTSLQKRFDLMPTSSMND